ncbi:MAG: hypothetical protein ACW990_07820 [Promethearchaeota archaeon]|jgi:hypothetical protein
MSNGKAIGIIGLIVGVAALGWLSYDQFFVQVPSSSRQYYDYNASTNYVPPGGAWDPNSGLSVDFTVNTGETVYFSYVAIAGIDDSSAPTSGMYFRFVVDGIRLYSPYTLIRRYNDDGGDADGRRVSVVLQHYNSSIVAGAHTVTVSFMGDFTADSVSEQTLFVHVFR